LLPDEVGLATFFDLSSPLEESSDITTGLDDGEVSRKAGSRDGDKSGFSGVGNIVLGRKSLNC